MINRKDKLLLVKDLCARLPHGVIVEHTSGFRGTINNIVIHQIYDENDNIEDYWCCADFFGDNDYIDIEFFKPYLFPLSSMTDEQENELIRITYSNNNDTTISCLTVDYLIQNHFDYRGLIPMGLAIDATGLNIY